MPKIKIPASAAMNAEVQVFPTDPFYGLIFDSEKERLEFAHRAAAEWSERVICSLKEKAETLFMNPPPKK